MADAHRTHRIMLPAALLLAAVGVTAATGIGPGPLILAVGAMAASVLRGRAGALVGLLAGFIVGYRTFGPDLATQVTGGGGVLVAMGRWVQFLGLAVALGTVGTELWRGRSRSGDSRGSSWPQVTGLVVLCAVGAELLTAYSDSTGHAGAVAFAVIFFAGLYGAPALLAREVARRRGWGWPSMLLMFAALGVAQACLIDQSMFSVQYQGYEGWERMRDATLVPAIGVSAGNVFNFVGGHLIYSFAAPVALAEAWRPERSKEPWLDRTGLVLAVAAYLGAAALIVGDPESRTGSAGQLVTSALIVVALLAAATVAGGRRIATSHPSERRLPLLVVFVLAVLLALPGNLGGETWSGVSLGVASTAAAGMLLLVASRRTAWTIEHCAVVALAFLVVRGGLAFTYYPLLGEVTAVAKYLHNVVMLAVVVIAGALATVRPAGRYVA